MNYYLYENCSEVSVLTVIIVGGAHVTLGPNRISHCDSAMLTGQAVTRVKRSVENVLEILRNGMD